VSPSHLPRISRFAVVSTPSKKRPPPHLRFSRRRPTLSLLSFPMQTKKPFRLPQRALTGLPSAKELRLSFIIFPRDWPLPSFIHCPLTTTKLKFFTIEKGFFPSKRGIPTFRYTLVDQLPLFFVVLFFVVPISWSDIFLGPSRLQPSPIIIQPPPPPPPLLLFHARFSDSPSRGVFFSQANFR